MSLKRIVNAQSKTITAAAGIVAISTLMSRILGFVRIHLFASFFGAGQLRDIYVAAFRLPDLIFTLLVTGGVSAGFIPIFTRLWHKKNNQAWELTNSVLNALLISLGVLSLILLISAPIIMPLIVPGFNAEQTKIVINLTRLLLLQPILLGISSVFSGVLHSFKRFVIVAIAPLLYNLGIIAGILFFYNWFGVYGLVMGVLLGAFLHMIIQLPSIIHAGFSYKPVLNFHNYGLKKLLKLMPSRSLSLLVFQINIFVITIIASTLGEGKIAVFNYADILRSFPLAVFGLAFAVGAFPSFAEFIAKNKKKKFIHSLINTLRQILFFLIPTSILLIVLRAQIVRVILGRGVFDWTATILTINCLKWFAFGLVAHAGVYLFSRAFWALQDTTTPFLAGLAGAVVNICGCLYLAPKMGIAGLALAFTASYIFTALILFIALRFRVGALEEKVLFLASLKILLASLLAGFACYGLLQVLAPMVNMKTFIGISAQGLLAGLGGAIIYIIACHFLKVAELGPIKTLIKARARRICEIIKPSTV